MANIRAVLKLSYIENFKLNDLTKVIFNEFDNYNYKLNLAQSYIDSQTTTNYTERLDTPTNHKSDPVMQAIIQRKKLLDDIEVFEKKIKELKSVLNDDELLVFHYCIEERETNIEVCDRMCKSLKTFMHIKKSCYVKTVLRLGLTKKLEKVALKTVSQLD